MRRGVIRVVELLGKGQRA